MCINRGHYVIYLQNMKFERLILWPGGVYTDAMHILIHESWLHRLIGKYPKWAKNKVYFVKNCSIFLVILRQFPDFLERFKVWCLKVIWGHGYILGHMTNFMGIWQNSFRFLVLLEFKTFFRVFWVQNKTGICLIYFFFIKKVEKISSIKTLEIWKTETQVETEN